MKHRDTVTGLFWLVIGLGLSIWTLTSYEIGRLTQPGPGYLPLALGIILILLSLILLVGQKKKFPGARQAVIPAARSGGWKKVVYTILVLTIAGFFFERVGYLLTFFFLIVLLMEPHGQARGPQERDPPTPLGLEAIRCANTGASVGHPPSSEIRRSKIRLRRKISIRSYAFLHGQSRGLLRRRMEGAERQSWKRIFLTALLTTVGVYVVFVLLLEVQLPRGFLGV